METKVIEIRDRGTFIPAIAMRLKSRSLDELYLLSRAGFGLTSEENERYVLLIHLEGMHVNYDELEWANNGTRTMYVVQEWLNTNFDSVKSGDVVDVQFILGETSAPKKSEKYEPLM